MRFVRRGVQPARDWGEGTASPDFDEEAASQRSDEGMATVWGAFAIAGLLVIAGLVWLVGHVAAVRQQAANAADLAALAAAGRVDLRTSDACRSAETVTDRMHVVLAECRVEHPDALVVVEAGGGPLLAAFGPVTARARAGPVSSLDEDPDDEQRSTPRDERHPRSVQRTEHTQESEVDRAPQSAAQGRTPRRSPRRTVRRSAPGPGDRWETFGPTVVSMLTHRPRTSGCRVPLSPGVQLAVKWNQTP